MKNLSQIALLSAGNAFSTNNKSILLSNDNLVKLKGGDDRNDRNDFIIEDDLVAMRG